jgi:hypothetical protein
MGLTAGELEKVTFADLDSYLADFLGPDDSPAYDRVSPTTDDSPAGAPDPQPHRSMRDLNYPIEHLLVSARQTPTPAPSVTSVRRDRRPPRTIRPRRSKILHLEPLKLFQPIEHVEEDETMYKDVAMYRYERAYEYNVSAPDDLLEGELFDDRLNTTLEWVRPNFRILDIEPKFCGAFGTTIVLRVEPVFVGYCYCRFDRQVVQGVVNKSGFARCRIPRRAPGIVPVYFSRDEKYWFGPVPFRYGVPGGFESLLIFAPIGTLLMGACAGIVWALAAWVQRRDRMRRRFLARGKK